MQQLYNSSWRTTLIIWLNNHSVFLLFIISHSGPSLVFVPRQNFTPVNEDKDWSSTIGLNTKRFLVLGIKTVKEHLSNWNNQRELVVQNEQKHVFKQFQRRIYRYAKNKKNVKPRHCSQAAWVILRCLSKSPGKRFKGCLDNMVRISSSELCTTKEKSLLSTMLKHRNIYGWTVTTITET